MRLCQSLRDFETLCWTSEASEGEESGKADPRATVSIKTDYDDCPDLRSVSSERETIIRPSLDLVSG